MFVQFNFQFQNHLCCRLAFRTQRIRFCTPAVALTLRSERILFGRSYPLSVFIQVQYDKLFKRRPLLSYLLRQE